MRVMRIPAIKVNCAVDRQLYDLPKMQKVEISGGDYPEDMHWVSPYCVMLQLDWTSKSATLLNELYICRLTFSFLPTSST